MTDKNKLGLLARTHEFEWDDNKRCSNVAKHRIDFVDATEVFRDPPALRLSINPSVGRGAICWRWIDAG